MKIDLIDVQMTDLINCCSLFMGLCLWFLCYWPLQGCICFNPLFNDNFICKTHVNIYEFDELELQTIFN